MSIGTMQGPAKTSTNLSYLLLIWTLLPMTILAASHTFFAPKIVTIAQLNLHNSTVLSPVSSLGLCALECIDLPANLFRYNEESQTCNITMYSKMYTSFWHLPPQEPYTEVHASRHYFVESKAAFVLKG